MKERIYRIRSGIPCTIALLSDLHGKDGGEALEILRRRRPSLITVTGDLFLGYKAQEGDDLADLQPNVIPFIQSCAELAPTYISLGNHEWLASPCDFQALKSTGAVLLDNAWVRDKETGLLIGGLTSAMVMDYRRFRKKHTPDLRYPEEKRHIDGILLRPSVRWLRAFEEQDGYKVLLCHHPEYWSLQMPVLMDHPIDLVLSGHAHGGQIRLFGHGLYSPGQGFLPRYTGGVFKGRHGNLVVSRGLANTAPRPIPRLFNPREVITIDLH
jgi:predicted MPP superfamily phosphohydrolase